jgi:hypothetical protein
MSFIADALSGKQIDSVHVDSELTYIMLSNGTQITIKGVVIVAPKNESVNRARAHNA